MKTILKIVICLTTMLTFSACALNAPTETPIPNDFMITYSNGGCYGRCPIYTVTIYANGNVVFEGFENVASEGVHTSTISQEKVTVLYNAVADADFFSLDDQYERLILDVGGYGIGLRINGKMKEISATWYPCRTKDPSHIPPSICELAALIPETANVDQWVKGP